MLGNTGCYDERDKFTRKLVDVCLEHRDHASALRYYGRLKERHQRDANLTMLTFIVTEISSLHISQGRSTTSP